MASSRPPTADSSSVVSLPGSSAPSVGPSGPASTGRDRGRRRLARPSSTGPSSRSTTTGPKPGRLELRAERVGVADEDDRRPRRRGSCASRRPLDGVDRRPPRSPAGSGPARRRAGRGRPARPAPRRPGPASRTGAGRRRRGSRGPPSARRRSTGARRGSGRARRAMSAIAGTVTSVLTAARARERPGRAAQVEAGARAVRVALLLAELHVQPRVEQPAEDRAHDRQRVEVGDPPRHPDVADPDLRLDRARPVDDPDEPLADGARVDDRAGRRRRRPPAPQPPSSRSAIAADVDPASGRRRR